MSATAVALMHLAMSAPALAGPGAHGANGEHLDAPSQQARASSVPKLEAKSELFELVATLGGGELSILVDRFDTNEPVLNAKVEVEEGGLKAVARFHADHGDYAVDDPAFLKALARPGEHALVFTIAAGTEHDLLDGTLRVSSAEAAHAHDDAPLLTRRNALAGGTAVVLAGLAGAFILRRRRAPAGGLQ
jgi:hypothetical protein